MPCENYGIFVFLEPVVQTLKIQDDSSAENVFYDSQSLSSNQEDGKGDQQIEVQVLQSGQIEFSAPNASTNADVPGSYERDVSYSTTCIAPSTVISSNVPALSTSQYQQTPTERLHTPTQSGTDLPMDSNSPQSFSMDVATQTIQPSAVKDPPLIICRSTGLSSTNVSTTHNTTPKPTSAELPHTVDQKQLQRSSKRHPSNTKRDTYNLRNKQTSPPPPKRIQLSSLPVEVPSVGDTTDLLQWGVEEVARFISSIPRCNCADVFRDHVSLAIC